MPAAATDLDRVEKEAGKLTKLRIVSDQNAANLATAEKFNRKLMRALEESQSRTNVTQVAVAVVGTGVGGLIGFKIAQRLRKYTDEKKWVNAKGERSIGAVIVDSVMIPVVGGLITIGGAYIDEGTLGAGVMGVGSGLLTGSLLHSLSVPKPLVIKV